MKIDLATLPAEGKDFEGELPADIFDLNGSDLISVSGVNYDLRVQRFDTELLLSGAVQTTFELRCMRCLQPFHQTILLPNAAISIELETGSEIDPSPQIREEILLELPTNPRCENGDEGKSCNLDPRYLAVDKPTNDGVNHAPASEKPSPWAALDALDSQE